MSKEWDEDQSNILAGDLSSIENELCIVVGDNDSTESPRSHVMYRIHDGRTIYMHEYVRLGGHWKRCGKLAASRL